MDIIKFKTLKKELWLMNIEDDDFSFKFLTLDFVYKFRIECKKFKVFSIEY